MDKVREELEELRLEAIAEKPDSDRLESEFGDLLFAAVSVGRFFHLNPEQALARANRKFMTRYAQMEKFAMEDGKPIQSMSLTEWYVYWNRVKGAE